MPEWHWSKVGYPDWGNMTSLSRLAKTFLVVFHVFRVDVSD